MSRVERNAKREAEKKHSKRVRRVLNLVFIFACLISILVYVSKYCLITITPEPEYVFAGGTTKDVAVYTIDLPQGDEEQAEGTGDDQKLSSAAVNKAATLVRGSSVIKINSCLEIEGVKYYRVDYVGLEDTDEMYMKEKNLVSSVDEVVQETEVYVRTPVTIYADKTGPAIASFAPKGSCLKVTGYDELQADGSINKYKVAYDENDETAEGYVYSKYLARTQKKADRVYNENGIYDKVKTDNYGYDLYGGKAKDLDYYPYEKTVIEGNEFCSDARAMYLNCGAAANPDNYIKLIKKTDCNAVVVDIKDGVLAWPAETAEAWSPKSYKTAYTTKKIYRSGIDKLRETGVYLIGRIVVFNDPIYAKDHPEDCIKFGGETAWPSGFSRDVWEYNVRLAQEAVKEFGFNEIQFDYVRFPENAFEMSKSKKTNFRNQYGEEKGQAIQNFCFYAADQLREVGAYISVDVFGESAYGYMTSYGQYWPGIANIVDAISAMPYTDHMGSDGSWEHPYATMNAWAKKAKKRQDYLENPAAARTWITGYNTPHWDPTVDYGEKELRSQIKGLTDAGLKGGFIPWNVTNDLDKYRQYQKIWSVN